MVLLPVGALAIYAGVASALMFWPTRAGPGSESKTIEAFVISNGVHTDYVFPMRSSGVDWSLLFPARQFRAAPPDAEFIAIGWGDREFYLHTPNWSDLTVARALSALRGANRAVLHVSWLRRADLGADTYRLPLGPAQYARLADWVRGALPGGQAVPIDGAHYGRNDAFYEASGGYHLFETCNTWTGRGLREAGIPMGRWTPFDFTVTHHLQRLPP